MRKFAAVIGTLALLAALGCKNAPKDAPANEVAWGASQSMGATLSPQSKVDPPAAYTPGVGYNGFDRNDYPGDSVMAAMRNRFAFTGFWLNDPPGESANSWSGKRATLRLQGWGFLVLFNGRLDKEIVASAKKGVTPAALGRSDADAAMAAATSEGFPAGTILFLDQEEGGRLLAEQASYLLAWTEAIAGSTFRAGVYASGQPVPDDANITTINDIRERVKAQHLHEVAMFDAQDTCPPAPGCTLQAKPMNASGDLDLTAWQYAQSPRRPELTKSCGSTYASDGMCYAPGFASTYLDMDVAASADPSHGR